MAEQIIIEFIGDATKLTPTVDVLEKLGQIDAKTADTFRKSNTELNKRSDIVKKITTEEQKQIKTIGDLEKAVDQLSTSFIEGFKDGVAETLAEAGVSAEDFDAALKGLNTTTDKAGSAQESLKKQLREMTAQLALLETQGKRNTVEYNQLLEKAGELKDAIGDANEAISNAGSDTRGIDNLIQLTGGVAGGFAMAQGAAALFGSENEEVQKTLLKVNAAMAILQGWQQISDLMSKRQFASTAALVGMQRVQTVQTLLQTGAESNYTVVRWASIAAQRVLNTVLAASPLGVILVLVTAVAAAFELFTYKAKKAGEEIKNNNNLLEKYGREVNRVISSIASEGDKNVKQLQSQFATQREIRNAEIENLELQKTQAQEYQRQANAQYSAAYKLYSGKKKLTQEESAEYDKALQIKQSADDQYYSIANKLRDLHFDQSKQDYEDDIKSYTAYQEAKVFLARKGSIAELNAQIDAIKARRDAELKLNPDLTAGEKAKLFAESERQILEIQNQITIKQLENQKYLMEAKLATIKEGTIAELEEKKKIAQKSYEIEVAQLGLSEEKKKSLRAQNKQDQEEFDRQIAERKLQFDLISIQTRLAKTKEGSADEFNLQLAQLYKQYQIDISAKGITNEKKLLLEAEYWKSLLLMVKQYNRKIQEEAIQTKQSDINAKLSELQRASVSSNNAEVIKLKKEAIDEQAQLDVIAAENSITNEKQKQAKIKEIIAKANADKRALDEAFRTAEINYQKDIINVTAENEKKKQELILAGSSASLKTRIAARKRIKEIEVEQIDNESVALENMHNLGLITEEDYQLKKLEIQGKYIDLELQREKEKEEKKKAIINAGFDVMRQISDAYFEVQAQNRQQDLDAALASLDKQKNSELDNKNLTEQQKANIDEKYKNREMQIKKRAWEAEQRAKEQQALINGALAITNILATMPKFDFGVASAIAIGAAIASTAIQVVKIRQARFPAYKTGTKNAPPGYALVGEEGPEIVKLSGGEKIYKYRDSMKIAEAWRGGSMASADDILMMGGRLPAVDHDLISNTYINGSGKLVMDYDKLGEAVASKLPSPVVNSIVMDEDGFTKYISENGNKTTVKNKRFKL